MESLRHERRRLAENREALAVQNSPRHVLSVPIMVKSPPPSNEVKLAAIAVELNIRLRSADMPCPMQERAFRCSRALLGSCPDNKPTPTRISMYIKKEFDAVYGPAWHCIVGKSFGSFVTHSSGGFVYFSVDKLSVLLFKTEKRYKEVSGSGLLCDGDETVEANMKKPLPPYRNISLFDSDSEEDFSYLSSSWQSGLPVSSGESCGNWRNEDMKYEQRKPSRSAKQEKGICDVFSKCFQFLVTLCSSERI